MARFLNEAECRAVCDAIDAEETELIGEQVPTAESKWGYYSLHRWGGKVYAIVVDAIDGFYSCGEEISEDEIGRYI